MLSAQSAVRPRPGGKAYVSPEGIIYCTDGKYRWVYEFDQRKRPTLLLSLLWKFVSVGAIAGMLALLTRVGTGAAAPFWSGLLITLALMAAGTLVSLTVFAAHILQNGPTQCLLFTADEDMISCQQVRGKTNKEKVAHAIAAWVGGQSQPSLRFYDPNAVRLDTVTSIAPEPKHGLIRVNGLKVYAEPEQFPLILNYLKRQCPRAK